MIKPLLKAVLVAPVFWLLTPAVSPAADVGPYHMIGINGHAATNQIHTLHITGTGYSLAVSNNVGTLTLTGGGAGSSTITINSTTGLSWSNVGSTNWTPTLDFSLIVTNGTVSNLTLRVAAIESATNNWNTAYGWGNHATAGYLTTTTGDARYLQGSVVGQEIDISGGTNLTLGGVYTVWSAGNLAHPLDLGGIGFDTITGTKYAENLSPTPTGTITANNGIASVSGGTFTTGTGGGGTLTMELTRSPSHGNALVDSTGTPVFEPDLRPYFPTNDPDGVSCFFTNTPYALGWTGYNATSAVWSVTYTNNFCLIEGTGESVSGIRGFGKTFTGANITNGAWSVVFEFLILNPKAIANFGEISIGHAAGLGTVHRCVHWLNTVQQIRYFTSPSITNATTAGSVGTGDATVYPYGTASIAAQWLLLKIDKDATTNYVHSYALGVPGVAPKFTDSHTATTPTVSDTIAISYNDRNNVAPKIVLRAVLFNKRF